MMPKSNRKLIVFDFDKTLTWRDTNLGFFRFAGKLKAFYPIRFILYIGFVVLRKIKLISNLKLKNLGLLLFIGNLSKERIVEISEAYSKTIKLKDEVMEAYNDHKKEGNEIIIISASVDSYVRPLFPEVKVFGSVIEHKGKKPYLATHCYCEAKVKILAEQDVSVIDELYTDNISDLPMARISNKIYLVTGSEVTICNSADEFIKRLKTHH